MAMWPVLSDELSTMLRRAPRLVYCSTEKVLWFLTVSLNVCFLSEIQWDDGEHVSVKNMHF